MAAHRDSGQERDHWLGLEMAFSGALIPPSTPGWLLQSRVSQTLSGKARIGSVLSFASQMVSVTITQVWLVA